MTARVSPTPRSRSRHSSCRRTAGSGSALLRRTASSSASATSPRSTAPASAAPRPPARADRPEWRGQDDAVQLLSGLFPPTAARCDRTSVVDGPTPERIVARGLARSFQITNLFPGLTVAENLRLGCQARDPRRFNLWLAKAALETVNAETRALIRFLGLEGLEQVPVTSLSYGGQRLVEIGIPLAGRPRVLLLDEPLVGLAAAERERITALIREPRAAHGRAAGRARHGPRVHARRPHHGDERGRVIAEGSADGPRTCEVQRVYLGSGASRGGRRARGPAPCGRRCSRSGRSTRSTARATCCTTCRSPCASAKSSRSSGATAPARPRR